MITLTIEDKQYSCPQKWSEITLQKFIELCNVEIPEKLRNLWMSSVKDDAREYDKAFELITIEDTQKHFPEYYGKLMEIISDIPGSVVDRFEGALRERFFNTLIRHYIFSIFTLTPVELVNDEMVPYAPDGNESFELNGQKYIYPKALKLYGEDIPMADEQIVTFAEASDIEVALRYLAEGAVDRFPMLIAIYCRKENEPYDENVSIQRAKEFLSLPMSVAWDVFFCIIGLWRKYNKSTQDFLKALHNLTAHSDKVDLTSLDGGELYSKLRQMGLTVQSETSKE